MLLFYKKIIRMNDSINKEQDKVYCIGDISYI